MGVQGLRGLLGARGWGEELAGGGARPGAPCGTPFQRGENVPGIER